MTASELRASPVMPVGLVLRPDPAPLEEAIVVALEQEGFDLAHRVEDDAPVISMPVPAERTTAMPVRDVQAVEQDRPGMTAMTVRNSAPARVRRVMMKSRNCAVGSPGRTPGM